MKISQRELTLAVATGIVALFGLSLLAARPRVEEWKLLRSKQASVHDEITESRALVAQRETWDAKMRELSDQLPQVPADKKMDVHWLSIMDALASKHGVTISKRQAGEEKALGEVYELPIDCKDWEGSLDSIVHFLFDLQSEGAMLEIRQMYLKPKDKGVLKGRFLLYCAYRRESAK